MARHNFVFLYGKVEKDPTIIYDKVSGEMLKGSLYLTVIHGTRTASDGTFGSFWYDCPQIVSQDPDMLYEIAQWKPNDVVFVKGILCTKNVNRTTICSCCGHKNKIPGVVSYITPTDCIKVMGGLTDKESKDEIKKNCELSNVCTLIGNVCTEPVFYRNPDNGFCQAQYQLAVNRKLRIKTDPAEKKTDYPWVKSNGQTAINDANFIRKGSTVLCDGYLQTREFVQKGVCEECGTEYAWKDYTLEAVPYSMEYLANCRTPEEMKRQSEETGQSVFDDIFA